MKTVGSTEESLLEQQAREWLVRLNSGRARPEDRQAATEWRAKSVEHERAFQHIEQVWSMLGGLGASADEANTRIARNKRARHAWIAAAAAAVTGVMIFGWLAAPPGGYDAFLADGRTDPGERREIALEDGSSIILNGASAANWDVTDSQRNVDLMAGEAYFKVARDAARPFVVSAGAAQIRVTGTAFTVKRLDGAIYLSVLEGHVTASERDGTASVAVLPGQRLTWRDQRIGSTTADDPEQTTAWMRGRIIVRDANLESIVHELERYRRGRIIVVGERARNVQITGVFDTRDPDGALTALCRSQDLTLYHATPLLTIIR